MDVHFLVFLSFCGYETISFCLIVTVYIDFITENQIFLNYNQIPCN
jgi:hypothetical protein